MLFNLKPNVRIYCENCTNTYVVDEIESINQRIDCKECKNQLIYSDWLVDIICSDESIPIYAFISDVVINGETDIIVGMRKIVEIPDDIVKVQKIYIIPYTNLHVVPDVRYTDKIEHFSIISSQSFDRKEGFSHESKFGEAIKVKYTIFAKKDDKELDIWLKLLIQSREQYLEDKFALSFLSCAMSLESYVSSRIEEYLYSLGHKENEINLLLKNSSIDDKLFRYLKYFYSVIFSPTVSNGKLKKIFEERNKIAHGRNFFLTKDEANKCFRIVIQAILIIHSAIETTKAISK